MMEGKLLAASNPLPGFQATGLALLATTMIFMIGAFSAAYFRQMPLPTEPLEKLTRIANDPIGWTAQAIIFPIAFLATTVIFGFLAVRLPGVGPRWLAVAATVLVGAACLLWLPITIHRLQLAANAAEIIRTYDPAVPSLIDVNLSVYFWAHTLSLLAALALIGAALALGGVLPTPGWVITALAVVSTIVAIFVMKDWPPFFSYIIMLVLAMGLIRLPS